MWESSALSDEKDTLQRYSSLSLKNGTVPRNRGRLVTVTVCKHIKLQESKIDLCVEAEYRACRRACHTVKEIKKYGPRIIHIWSRDDKTKDENRKQEKTVLCRITTKTKKPDPLFQLIYKKCED